MTKKISKLVGLIALAVVMCFGFLEVQAEEASIAKVNGQDCSSWDQVEQQIEAAESPITIQLLSTISLEHTFVIPAGKNVTIDLNGQELKAQHGNGYGIQNLGDLTITSTNEGGKLTLNTATGSGVINSGNTLKIENITIWAGSTYAAVKNSNDDGVVRTLEVKNTEISGNFVPGIQAAGKVTIEDVKFSLSKGSILIAVPGGQNDTEVTVKNVKTTNRGLMYAGDGIRGLESLDDTTGKAKLHIEGVTGNVTFFANNDSVIEGDETMTEKAITYAKDGASIIIPEGYNKEIPNKAGVKYITKEGTEVVYVNFDGVNYELNKGDTWGQSTKEELKNALEKAKTEGQKNKTFQKFVKESGEEVTDQTPWNENGTISIEWGVKVTINGQPYDLDENETLQDIPTFGDFNKEGKTLHFRTVSGKEEVKDTDPITQNIDLETFYTVTVTLDDVVYTLDLGKNAEKTRLGNAVSADGTILDTVMKTVPVGKYAVTYYIDGKATSSAERIDENTILTKKVLVKISVNGSFIGTVEDGTILKNISILDSIMQDENFKYFKVGEEVFDLESAVTQEINLKPVYKIVISVEGNDRKNLVEVNYDETSEGITLQAILDGENGSELKKFMDAENFARFVDEDGNTVDLDTVITTTTKLKAIYEITLTFIDEKGNTWTETVLEGTSLKELASAEQLKKVEGKTWKGFINADTKEAISEDEELMKNTSIQAVFESSTIEVPSTYDGVMNYFVLALVSFFATFVGIVTLKRKENV